MTKNTNEQLEGTLGKYYARVEYKGTIGINGRIASMLEVGTGFHPELTGRENIYMNGAILGMTKAEISSKFDDIVEFAELSRFIESHLDREVEDFELEVGSAGLGQPFRVLRQ